MYYGKEKTGEKYWKMRSSLKRKSQGEKRKLRKPSKKQQ